MLVSVVVLSNNIHAQIIKELHQDTLYEIANHTSSNQIAHINVGVQPILMAVGVNKIYVANSGDKTVSVIDGENNTKIGDIKVGSTTLAISVNHATNKIYVANSGNNSVSVIDGRTDKKIDGDIKVGSIPSSISVNPDTNTIYVANKGDDTISVIDGRTDKKINDIPVGLSPSAMDFKLFKEGGPYSIYVANSGDNSVSVIDGRKILSNSTFNIPVGPDPSAISVNPATNKIYVANSGNNSVSVIDGRLVRNINGDIKVGSIPSSIYVGVSEHLSNYYIYVINSGDNSVSVIDGSTDKKINDIPVGLSPSAMDFNSKTLKLYVASFLDNTVSVIMGNTSIGNIKVGLHPTAISVNPDTNTIYVANSGDNTVSVIDGETDKVVARIMFYVDPFNAGHIECDKNKLISPIAKQFYIWSGTKCTAKSNPGYEFISWQENLNKNSNQLINFSSSISPLGSIMNFLQIPYDKPEATINITKFGSFTANFKALPPPIPAEYLATLFTVVVTAFIGTWLTPTVIGWRKAKNQGRKLDFYHNELRNLYNDYDKLDGNDIGKLNNLRDRVTDEYTTGKINKEQFDKLVDDISIRYREIFKNKIDSLDDLSEYDKEEQLKEIKSNIENEYATGKINELHYNLLQKKLFGT